VKVLLFTSDEPLYLPRYIRPIFEEHHGKFEEVVVSPFNVDVIDAVRKQMRMLGPRAFTKFGLRFIRGKLLGSLPKKIFASDRFYSVTEVTKHFEIATRHETDINDGEFVAHVRELDPDLILSILCGQKLGEPLLEIPDEAVNVHGSLLPKYRGRATAFWPLYYGDEKSGVTAHRMNSEFDGGEILTQREFEIDEEDTLHDMYNKIADTGASLTIELLEKLPKHDFDTTPNEATENNYYTIPTKREREEFRERGNRFL
jgi:folate-dependent phosphoribosylglycinamide formyltransferase PurN